MLRTYCFILTIFTLLGLSAQAADRTTRPKGSSCKTVVLAGKAYQAVPQQDYSQFKEKAVQRLLERAQIIRTVGTGPRQRVHRIQAIASVLRTDPVYGKILDDDQLSRLATALIELPENGLLEILQRSEIQLNLPTQGPYPKGVLAQELQNLKSERLDSKEAYDKILSLFDRGIVDPRTLTQLLIAAKIHHISAESLKELYGRILDDASLLTKQTLSWMVMVTDQPAFLPEEKIDLLVPVLMNQGVDGAIAYKAASITRAWLFELSVGKHLEEKTIHFLQLAIERGNLSKETLRQWRPSNRPARGPMENAFLKLLR